MRKIVLTFTICIGIFISTKISAQTQYEEFSYNGMIGSSPIVLTFFVPNNFYNYIQGSYYYTKYNSIIEFRGEEGVFEGAIKLTESVNGKKTGYFVFNNIDGIEWPRKIVGKWYNIYGSKSYDVTLSKK